MNTAQSFPDLGKYRILEVLGQGRFATVYKVEDTTMGRLAAVKVFAAPLFQDEVWMQHLQDKLRILARLDHPHIVHIYEIGTIELQAYIVMQLGDAGSLAQTIAAHSGQSIAWAKTLNFLKPVCEALHYAHEQGLVHSDLKPANILINPPGGALLADFGLTYLMSANPVGMSRIAGGIIGTLPYVAPEVWETEPPEIPADIYALGCITYEMLLGQALFAGTSTMQAMHAHAQGPQFPQIWPAGVPKGIEDVLRTALAWDKATRYPTPLAFWDALNKLGSHPTASTGTQLAAMANQWKGKVEDAVKSGKLQLAKMAVTQWLAAEPTNPEAIQARDKLDQQMAAAQSIPTPVSPSPAPVQTPPPTSPQPVPVQPPVAAPQPTVIPQPVAAPLQVAAPPQLVAAPAQPAPQPTSVPVLFSFATLPDGQPGTLTNPYTVEQFLSTEGQLGSYPAEVNGRAVMLRWFFPDEILADTRDFIDGLIQQGSPSANFLWPTHSVESADMPGFGYIMPAREERFKNLEDLVKRWVEPTFYTLTTMLLNLVDSFMALHLKGLTYSAISPRMMFFDPDNGDIALIYHDNIVNNNTPITIDDTYVLRFMAPEIVRGGGTSGQQVDLYALATLLFYTLMVHHPLEGERVAQVPSVDLPNTQRLFGTAPVFIFDPTDESNRPVPGYHVNAQNYWPLYPQFIRDMFIRAFTEGLHRPYAGRIRTSEWRQALVRLRDTIIYCPQCSVENFYDVNTLKTTGSLGTCWSCQSDLLLPPRLRVSDRVVMLNYNTKLYPHHLDPDKKYDFSQPVAEVVQHPRNSSIWGLRNLTGEKWVITTDDGNIKDVAPTRSLTLSAGVKINFGKQEGEIRV